MNQFFLHMVSSIQMISVVSLSKSLSLLVVKPPLKNTILAPPICFGLCGMVDTDNPKCPIAD